MESSKDNVPTKVMVNFMWVSQDSYEETQVEVMITLVNTNWRKTSDTPEPKWQAVRERYWGIVVLIGLNHLVERFVYNRSW